MIKKFTLLVVWLVLVWALAYPFVYQDTTDQKGTGEAQKPGAESTQAKQPPEEPLHDVDLPDFGAIADVKEKKKQFFDFIRTPIEQANARLRQQRATLTIALMMTQAQEPLSDIQTEQVQQIFNEFDITEEQISEVSLNQALRRVDIVPKELVMMQAANESAWGTSRFARIGLNFFGQWCFSKGCGMVPRARNRGAQHEVAAFSSVKEAVDAYFHNINTNSAYRELRDIRANLRAQDEPVTARALSYGLMAYSERGEAYIEELQAMMNHNEAYFEE